MSSFARSEGGMKKIEPLSGFDLLPMLTQRRPDGRANAGLNDLYAFGV